MHYKKTIVGIFIVTLLFILSSNKANADYYHQIFTFEKENLKFEEIDEYDLITYKDFELSREIGSPQLPIKIVQLILPQNKEISAITIVVKESEYLDGEYSIYPAQPPQILSSQEDEIEFVQPKEDIYSSSQAYPEDIIKIGKQGYFAGYNIGSLLIYPLQYIPAEKRVIFHSKIEIEISYKEIQKSPIAFSRRTDYVEKILNNTIRQMVKNSTDVPDFLPGKSIKNSRLPDEEHLYVIITSDELVSSFLPLADWKLKKGLSATMVTTSWIYTEYSGIDNAEKMRNFIKDAYQTWGTMWVLLGGDINQVPYRTAFAFDCEYGSFDDNYLPCDLYFSDLDGNWNANGNDIYGELEDNIDMYPDVYVGRATVENTTEATDFVNKILTYEKNPSMDYQLNMLFLAMVLWWDPYTDSGVGKNFIDDMYVPERFDPITKLYQSLGNETYDSVMVALNNGQNIINHDGHAGWSVLCIGSDHLYRSDMDALTNAPAYSIFYSIGCWPAAFDYDCIAEHFITNPDGGGVAFIGNSRYGWGSPGNPLYGYSDRFDQEFYHQIFDNNIFHIGNTLASAKTTYIPLSAEGNVYRWCEYEINLLGEPEMPIWTDIPNDLVVLYPDELPLGDSFCQITVTDGNNPIEDALVCLMQGEDVYETGITGIDGQVDFDISTSNPSNDIQLTVTVQDFIPFESTISITSGMAYVQISSYSTNGSDEGYVIPGELDSMDIWLHNYGNLGATNISVLLTTDDSKITMIDSTELIGSIPAGDSIFVENAFSFQASDNLANEETVYLNSEITDDESNYWTTLISIIGATPVISYFYHNIIDSLGGDGDGIAEPGETVNPNIILKNEGLALAQNVDAILWCDNPYIEIPECIWEFGDILPSGFGQTLVEIGIDENCPAPSFPQIGILIMTEDGYQFSDSFLVIIGETGFQDDMEAGDENWTHYGTDDLWHLTSNRKFSGDYSWYCGNEGEFLYNDDIEEFLVSSPIILGQNAELSFWCWYKFPNYGTDGFYVEVNDGSGWTDLDFIGSGGALGILTIGNDWLEYKYDLSNYAPETELTLRFRFVSSSIIDGGEVAEGVYIDDVKIKEKSEIVFADFSADVTSGIMPLTVEFTDVSHSAVDSIVDWYWNFGDGETSTEQNPTHIYEIQGKKTVSLTVTDEFGFTTTKIKVDYIDVSTGGGYVIYVNPDGSGDYTNLHDGIEAVYDGDTLLVADAIYTGYQNKNISFDGKSVIVISENGMENCIIECEGSGFAFILEHNDSLATINGFTIRNTHTYGNGGAINCDNASAKIENCIFENCITDQSGGAVFGSSNSNLIISNCQFINCNALTGGGIYVSNYDEFVLENCTFDDNSADFAAGIKIISTLSSIVQNCNFNDGIAVYDGGAIYITDCDSISLKDCEIANNSAQDGVGIYLITSNSIEMKNISITNNEASHYGGGIYTCEANTTMENCIISSNSANRGGGIYLTSSNAQFINCLVISNSAIGTASMGGGIYTNASNPDFINCTVANNSAVSYAGGIFVYSSDVNVVNSIFWGDTPQEIFPTTANLIAEYSDIQGGWTGDGNIDEDPLFVAGYPFDYHFTENSSCIDAGSNDYVWVDSDLDGNVRIWDGDGDEIAIVDMGCYEFGAPPVSVEPEPEPQTVITLYQNYPNPFSALTTISFNLATDLHGLSPLDSEHLTGQAQIRIYNIKGQLLRIFRIPNPESRTPNVIWNGKDEKGKQLSNGIYFYSLKIGDRIIDTKKCVILR